VPLRPRDRYVANTERREPQIPIGFDPHSLSELMRGRRREYAKISSQTNAFAHGCVRPITDTPMRFPRDCLPSGIGYDGQLAVIAHIWVIRKTALRAMIDSKTPPHCVVCVKKASSALVADSKTITCPDPHPTLHDCAWNFPPSMYFDCPYVRGWSRPVAMPAPCTDYDHDFPPLGYRPVVASTVSRPICASNIDQAWEVRPMTRSRAQLLYTSVRTEKFRAGYGRRMYVMTPLLMARYRHRKPSLVGIETNPGPVDDGPEINVDPPPVNPNAIDIDGIPVMVRPREPNSPYNFVPNISRALRYAHRAIAFMESRHATIIVAECRNQQEVVNVTVLLTLLRQFITDLRYERSYFRCLGILGRTLRQPRLISARTRAFVESMLLRSGIEPNPGPPHRRPKVGKPPGVNRQARRQQRTRAGIQRAEDMRRGHEDAQSDYDRDYPPLDVRRGRPRRNDDDCPWPVKTEADFEQHGPSVMVPAPVLPSVADPAAPPVAPPPPADAAAEPVAPAPVPLQRFIADHIIRESLSADYEAPSLAPHVTRPFHGGRQCVVSQTGDPMVLPLANFMPQPEICSTFRVSTRFRGSKYCCLPMAVPLRSWVITTKEVGGVPAVETGRACIYPDTRPLSFRATPICENRPHTIEAILYSHNNRYRNLLATAAVFCGLALLAYIPLLLLGALLESVVASNIQKFGSSTPGMNETSFPASPDVYHIGRSYVNVPKVLSRVHKCGYFYGTVITISFLLALVAFPLLGVLVRLVGVRTFARRRVVHINKTALQDLMFKKPFSDYRSNVDYLSRLVSAAWDASDPSVLHYTALAAADYAQYMRDELMKSAPELGGH